MKKIFFLVGLSYSFLSNAQFATGSAPTNAFNWIANSGSKFSIGTSAAPTSVLDVKGDVKVNMTDQQSFVLNYSKVIPNIGTIGTNLSLTPSTVSFQGNNFSSQWNVAFSTTNLAFRPYNSFGIDIGTSIYTSPNASVQGLFFTASGANGGVGNIVDIGTLESKGIALGTNKIRRLFIDASGNVGIGNTTPAATLDVTGDMTLRLPASKNFQILNGVNSTALFNFSQTGNLTFSQGSLLRNDQGGSIELGGNDNTTTAGVTPYFDFHFGNSAASTPDYNVRLINNADRTLNMYGALVVSGNGNPSTQKLLSINGDSYLNGSVGIATQIPEAKLHIQDITVGSTTDKLLMVGDDTYFTDIDKSGALALQSKTNTAEAYFQLGNGGMTLYGNTTKLEIGQYDGSGTFQKAFSLRNNGTLAVKELCTNPTMSWCDYVFAKDYKLRKLSELESYITEHQHLPEIPAAEAIKEQGIQVGEMPTLQMKKIEELTLYILEQEKNMKAQEERIKNLESQINK